MAWVAIAVVLVVIVLAFLVAAKKAAGPKASDDSHPYARRDALLTPAERSFLGVLEQAVEGKCRVYIQVRLADLITVRPGIEKSLRTTAQNRINSKHADFVLCRSDTLGIICAIELDDSSHEKASRKHRDRFVEAACQAAGLPLVRFAAKSSYQLQEVRSVLAGALEQAEGVAQTAVAPRPVAAEMVKPSAQPSHEQAVPACPKCGGVTVLRTVKAGVHAGSKLWGCKNYPTCRGYIPLNT